MASSTVTAPGNEINWARTEAKLTRESIEAELEDFIVSKGIGACCRGGAPAAALCALTLCNRTGTMLDDLVDCMLGDRPANPVQYAIEHLRTTYADLAVTAPAAALATRFGAPPPPPPPRECR